MSLPNDALNQISAAYGSVPTATGAQSIYLPCFAFEAEEATTFGSFYDQAGDEILFHPWKGKTLAEGKTAFFGQNVARFTITVGGKGQCFPTSDEFPEPELVSVTTTSDGATLLLTFDRPMHDPAGYEADFEVLVNAVANVVTVAGVNVADPKVLDLTLTAAVVFGDLVTISMEYGRVKSALGANALPIIDEPVTNAVPQIPVLQSAQTNAAGTLIVLTYDIDMHDPAANLADFSLKYTGVAKVINAAALGADIKTIELTPAVAAVNADAITLSLVAGNIQGATGGKVAALVNQAVVNNVPV